MSKAFTREDGAVEPPLRALPVSGPARPITPAGFRELTQAVQEAEAELSALRASPSVEHDARLPSVQSRLAQLRATLQHVVPQASATDAEGRATFGAHVELRGEDGARLAYQLVGPDETDARQGKVSVQSPLGAALLGKREGESVLLERPRGELELTVQRVRYD